VRLAILLLLCGCAPRIIPQNQEHEYGVKGQRVRDVGKPPGTDSERLEWLREKVRVEK
jgi:hypothetical protein